jgi:hypothetical protein
MMDHTDKQILDMFLARQAEVEAGWIPSQAPAVPDIAVRLREHVRNRGGSTLGNGAWDMMLEAADEIERTREVLKLVRRALKEECDYITDEIDAHSLPPSQSETP